MKKVIVEKKYFVVEEELGSIRDEIETKTAEEIVSVIGREPEIWWEGQTEERWNGEREQDGERVFTIEDRTGYIISDEEQKKLEDVGCLVLQ